MERLTECKCRSENGNCLMIGGFCTSVPENDCNMAVKLKEYMDLEEQGRLLKLPCAVGDVVYEIDPIEETIEKKKIDSIELHEYGVSIFARDISDSFDTYDTSDFGGVVFFTREEAEAALNDQLN